MNDHPGARLVSPSPHAHSGASVQGIMRDVIIALSPALAAGIALFGFNAIRLTALCVCSCVVTEYVARRMMRRDPGITDLSAVVTGLLLAMNLPPTLPGWMAVVGSVFSIAVVKQMFGGIGYNLFNPALMGRCMLLVSFPVAMTSWALPRQGFFVADAVTGATPLGAWKTALMAGLSPAGVLEQFPLTALIVGARPGCIGETSVVALLLGGLYLLWRRCISWHIPGAYLGTVAIFAMLLKQADPARNLEPLVQLCSGGLFLGALFMATDMVTTPVTRRGMLLFGAGCGALTMVIRQWGGYPEGVSFSIVIMNALTPLINRFTRPRPFGHQRKVAP
jgi:electron transport complex protein RnfD